MRYGHERTAPTVELDSPASDNHGHDSEGSGSSSYYPDGMKVIASRSTWFCCTDWVQSPNPLVPAPGSGPEVSRDAIQANVVVRTNARMEMDARGISYQIMQRRGGSWQEAVGNALPMFPGGSDRCANDAEAKPRCWIVCSSVGRWHYPDHRSVVLVRGGFPLRFANGERIC